MAQGRLSLLLALEVAPIGRAAADRNEAAGVDPADERRKSAVGSCVKKTRERHAVRKMKEDRSEPSCRGRLQTAISCFGPKIAVVNVMVKRRDRRSRHVWIREMSANDPLMKHRKQE